MCLNKILYVIFINIIIITSAKLVSIIAFNTYLSQQAKVKVNSQFAFSLTRV